MQNLENDLVWFEQTFSTQIQNNLLGKNIALPEPPEMNTKDVYGKWVKEQQLNVPDRLLLLLAMIPHINPSLIDFLVQHNLENPGDHPEMGGIRGTHFRGFIPTGETAMFLLGGSHVSDRLRSRQYIEQESKVFKPSIVGIKPPKENEPRYSGVWEIDEELLELLTLGKTTPPAFSLDFPAKEINTPLEWSDLILDKRTKEQLMEVASWLAHKDVVLEKWKLAKRIKKGYKVLFHGPSGTGKTLAATLLGKQTETPVYRIDLSVVVSKYIGETEKNLSKLFDKAENKNWILFFDEADALFGKRTSVRDAHDKYANQEVSYLLQRVEDYEGLVILASNLKGNIDSAFLRRFQSVVHFPKPQVKEREQLWKSMWPEKVKVEGEGTLEDLARQHELTGANILNVIQFACLKAAQGKQKKVLQKDLYTAIRRELTKEGKLI
jgi:hypothetical protein